MSKIGIAIRSPNDAMKLNSVRRTMIDESMLCPQCRALNTARDKRFAPPRNFSEDKHMLALRASLAEKNAEIARLRRTLRCLARMTQK